MISSPTRRGWLYGGVALVAAAAGVGGAWWTQRRAAKGGGEKLDAAFWAQRFERPEGGEVVFDSLRGKPLVVNFWATWCPPCVEEMPMIDAFFRENAGNGWQVVGLCRRPAPARGRVILAGMKSQTELPVLPPPPDHSNDVAAPTRRRVGRRPRADV